MLHTGMGGMLATLTILLFSHWKCSEQRSDWCFLFCFQLNDMMTFFSIFFVFTSAYGVASFSLLKSGQPTFDVTIFRKIFHGAYW